MSNEYPYTVHRVEHDDGTIAFEIYDERPEFYRFVCSIDEWEHDGRVISAQREAEMICHALNAHGLSLSEDKK